MNKSDREWLRNINRRIKKIGETIRSVREHAQTAVYRVRLGSYRDPYEPCHYCKDDASNCLREWACFVNKE